MNRQEAEDFVYRSYLRAEMHIDYNSADSSKRHPELTREIIESKKSEPCVVVTGSKGKGSVSLMIALIMRSICSVGLMTSPHVLNFCERFNIDGQNISDDDLAFYMTDIEPLINAIEEGLSGNEFISPMGIQALMALEYFHDKGTSFNVFECGKGARFDDVNNIPHEYAVINRIFLEHTRELGKTLKEIAYDKSHVIDGRQKCVYVAGQDKEAFGVIEERCHRYNTQLKVYGKDFYADNIRYLRNGMVFDVSVGSDVYKDIRLPLFGNFQAENCALSMALCRDVLRDMGKKFMENEVRSNLLKACRLGRMDIITLKEAPERFVLLDACINKESCREVRNTLRELGIKRVISIIGIPDDKDYEGVVCDMNTLSERIILTKSGNPHYKFSRLQADTLAQKKIEATWTESVKEAVSLALSYNDLVTDDGKGIPIVILGTTSVISDVFSIL